MSNRHTARPQPVGLEAQVNTGILRGEIHERATWKTLREQSY